MDKPIQITVGAGGYNPVAGATEYNNPDLRGLDGYVVKSGYAIFDYNNWEPISSGGFRLLNGNEFSDNEIWFFVPTGIEYNTSGDNYTNGFKYSQVISKLFPRIGWRRPTKDGYANI